MSFVTSAELLNSGFTPCNDGDLRAKVFDLYDPNKIVLLNDKDQKPQLFIRHGEDVYSHYKTLNSERNDDLSVAISM
ncbi:hypothetical protein [Heyndrickxia sporothermodurans]|uniref:hypothetical protein n=1 Tax=Heyndrickxia sporothermodurans TaxID=46224 RepID=UPI000D369A70|nr:hypothetical protein [Heyndrickxia sporothermodurans]PTY92941.1 hypothetical protein B5V90_02350 [Heyndrickxia sporothermodurans]